MNDWFNQQVKVSKEMVEALKASRLVIAPKKEPSSLLTMPLLPYQKEALQWMTGQENSSFRGGILADEMGMGKTIQAISVIVDGKENAAPSTSSSSWLNHPCNLPVNVSRIVPRTSCTTNKGLTRSQGTLVVCPVVAVVQVRSVI